jgi:hypothetical protein
MSTTSRLLRLLTKYFQSDDWLRRNISRIIRLSSRPDQIKQDFLRKQVQAGRKSKPAGKASMAGIGGGTKLHLVEAW